MTRLNKEIMLLGMPIEHAQEAIRYFQIPGELRSFHPFKVGHINETYTSVWIQGGTEVRYLHQLINSYVFRDIPGLMRNVELVVEHIRSKAPAEVDPTLTIVPTNEGRSFCCDQYGNYWRTYKYIENSITYEMCSEPALAHEAAKTVGSFLSYLSDLSPRDFCETIPDFHNFPNRFKLLREAQLLDVEHRVKGAQKEVDFAFRREAESGAIIDKLRSGVLPVRVTHNDLKFNNVLFSKSSARGICVVDLDTCMPGSALYDFGDLVRSVGVSAKEDELDLEKVTVNLEYFERLVAGYLEATKGILHREEIELMYLAPRLLALALGVRFLTDHLAGDVYFKIHHADHNLERARTQFRIVAEMDSLESEMKDIVQQCLKNLGSGTAARPGDS